MNFKKERFQNLRNGGGFSHSAEPTRSGVVVTGGVGASGGCCIG